MCSSDQWQTFQAIWVIKLWIIITHPFVLRMYKQRSLPAVSWATPFLRIAPELLVVHVASLITMSFSVILPKNEKLRWPNNGWGFQQSFLKAEGWRMTGCFGATQKSADCFNLHWTVHSSSQSIFQTWSLAWLERLNSGRHYCLENTFWSGTTFFSS